jgi:hypothetical protein
MRHVSENYMKPPKGNTGLSLPAWLSLCQSTILLTKFRRFTPDDQGSGLAFLAERRCSDDIYTL